MDGYELWRNACGKLGITLRYFALCLILEAQDKYPFKVAYFRPIDVRVTRLLHGETDLITEPLETPRDLPHYFEPKCNRCMANYEKDIHEDFHYIHAGRIEISRSTQGHIQIIKNGVNDEIKDFAVAPHPLDSNFSLGKLNAFRIDIMNSNGYVRAASVRENDPNLANGSKLLFQWRKSKATQELIHAYAEDLELPEDKLIVEVKNVCIQLRGVYLHPDLVIDFACWISPKFKILTQRILRDHFRFEAQARVTELSLELSQSHSKIDRLESRIIQLQKSVDQTNSTLEPLRNFRDKSISFIDTRIDRISCSVSENLEHRFILSRIEPKKEYDYVITRIQKRNRNAALLNKAQDLGVRLITIYEIQSANPINLTHQVAKIQGVTRFKQFIKISIAEQHFLLAVDEIVRRDVCDYKIIKSEI